jgi:hypothetical protein
MCLKIFGISLASKALFATCSSYEWISVFVSYILPEEEEEEEEPRLTLPYGEEVRPVTRVTSLCS